MKKAVLIDGVRTPIGRFQGELSKQTAKDLGVATVTELLRRYPNLPIDEVILAQVIQAGQGQNPARQVATQAGLPLTIPAMTLNNVCLASMASVADAVRRIERNEGEMFIIGGFESMTNAPYVANLRKGIKMGPITFSDTLDDGLHCSISEISMGKVGEAANQELNILREAQDEYAAQSQSRALQAQQEGRLVEEIVPVQQGNQTILNDECIRPQTTMDSLQQLKPAFAKDGTITAGNASQLSDGASAGLISSKELCEHFGMEPMATIIDWATIAGPDTSLHLKPAHAIQTLLKRTGFKLSDIDLFEINEAFAGVVIASQQELGIASDIVNVNGGAISLGHPLGASGFRLVLTLAKELKRRGGGRGIATLCGGGGQGMAICIEV